MDKFFELKEKGEYTTFDLNILLEDCCKKLNDWLLSPTLLDIVPKKAIFKLEPDTHNDYWVMARGNYFLFSELYAKGFKRIAVWKLLEDNTYAYSIAKKSEFVSWDINKIIRYLNNIEKGWGGSSTIAGAPRNFDGSRSKIKPEELVDIINSIK